MSVHLRCIFSCPSYLSPRSVGDRISLAARSISLYVVIHMQSTLSITMYTPPPYQRILLCTTTLHYTRVQPTGHIWPEQVFTPAAQDHPKPAGHRLELQG
jgi:hypothetical protein